MSLLFSPDRKRNTTTTSRTSTISSTGTIAISSSSGASGGIQLSTIRNHSMQHQQPTTTTTTVTIIPTRQTDNSRQHQKEFQTKPQNSTNDDSTHHVAPENRNDHSYQHLYVLPVLLLEFLALAITRAVLPSILLREYGNHVYIIMGLADFVRGFFAFLACPMFGKLSDTIGRRLCLFITVFGTCAPVCSLALFSWQETTSILFSSGSAITAMNMYTNVSSSSSSPFILENTMNDETPDILSSSQPTTSTSTMWDAWIPTYTGKETHPFAITIFVLLLGLSGFFSSTFTLVFAYISDTVREQDERVSAYGLALATFGLSFTIGPMLGGYLAQTDQQYVFLSSLLLTILDLLYIYFILPESKSFENSNHDDNKSRTFRDSISLMSMDHKFSWNPVDTLRIVMIDPFLRQVGKVAFLYYTGLWALISTLSVYAVQRFHLSPERLGELISVLGLSTMIAEAALVRIIVPLLGEKRAIQLGLASFCLQCVTLGFAYEGWHLFICAAFSLLGNLVYPSLSSLVSGSVEPDAVGEALGAINGIKALTEGIGPLFFGSLMTISEKSSLPGWPYLLAATLVFAAYMETKKLPDIEDDDYIHELERKKKTKGNHASGISKYFSNQTQMNKYGMKNQNDDEEELNGLLSEIEDFDDQDYDSDDNNK